jgi:hypothetical protein
VNIDGETFVDVHGGNSLQREVPPRLLLRLRENGVEPVCRIEQKPHYMPQPVIKP